MWLVKKSWCVHCCSIHQFYWVSDSWWSEFALWWFFVRKKIVVTVLAVCLSFWSWLPDITWVYINLKDRAAFLGLIMHCLLVDDTCEFLVFDFSFFWNHVSLCVYQWCGFSRYKFFHFWSQCLADIIILLCSFLFSSTGVVIVALANLRWSVFDWIKLSEIGSFHELLVLATESFFSFDISEIHSDPFLGF